MSAPLAPSFTEFQKLSKDIRTAVRTLDRREARYLVDTYYQMQEYRISSDNQVRSMATDGEPHETLSFFGDQMRALEGQIKTVLKDWVETEPSDLGKWAISITGIGPVIAAGLLAHIDIEKANTAGQIWRFAGLDPTSVWNKGEKRPWNASLKVICWKAGESFVKVSGNEKDVYGKYYIARKQFENERNDAVIEVTPVDIRPTDAHSMNEQGIVGYLAGNSDDIKVYQISGLLFAGGNAQAAWQTLNRKKIGKDTDAYKAYSKGKLPPAHIHARAKRYAVKLFIAHYHEVGRKLAGLPVPAPYPIAILGHSDYIAPPNGNGEAA